MRYRAEVQAQALEAARAQQRHRQQDHHEANRLDDELHKVRQSYRPHATEDRIEHYHAAANQDRGNLAKAE